MLWTIVVIILILWLLGFTVLHVGSLIHILLVVALVVIVIRLLQGRSAL
ncbi:MAG: lmo0937 family membrane protein [Sphingomonas sp.]|nr:lmo0937 family membrane protein [Sphingomonas sp.]MBN8806885.1 lmo0937 family membrane protein [Sphingomonas sp.]